MAWYKEDCPEQLHAYHTMLLYNSNEHFLDKMYEISIIIALIYRIWSFRINTQSIFFCEYFIKYEYETR